MIIIKENEFERDCGSHGEELRVKREIYPWGRNYVIIF